ncbi:MAG: AMP-binding protein [Nocardioides sp.]|uniref:AMP-binding protein n=1 Tax=Nocardioides sp. TaxID=35761 RepID=UPI0039E46604
MDEARIARLADWLSGTGSEGWVVETSGSTGVPKRVVLSRAAVEASIDLSARRLTGSPLSSGRPSRWLLAVPAGFVAGMNVVSRALAAGAPPVVLADHPDFTAATEALGDARRFCSLVPTQLHRLLASDAAALASYHTVLVGGGPIDPALRSRAAAAGVRMVATYGSAETCGGCVYDGVPFDGVRVATGPDGRLRIAGPTLFDRYDGEPELTARTLVDGWFLTSDAARIEDGRLTLLGRLDDMVVSGGVNVPAALVGRRLREHPGVHDAECLGVPDEEWGNRVVAFVVPDRGPADPAAEVRLGELRDWVAAAHPRTWAPRQVVVLPRRPGLPRLPNGKPDRLRLAALAQQVATGRAATQQAATGQAATGQGPA